jgi:hypothetical protein
MLQAWISSPRGSLYFAAPVTTYNLETLRTHVRALRDESPACTCLSLNPGGPDDGAMSSRISVLVAELRDDGVDVRLSPGNDAAQTASPRKPRVTPPRRRRAAR